VTAIPPDPRNYHGQQDRTYGTDCALSHAEQPIRCAVQALPYDQQSRAERRKYALNHRAARSRNARPAATHSLFASRCCAPAWLLTRRFRVRRPGGDGG
jgi:hypothetical protein